MNAQRPFDPVNDAPLLSAYVDGELDAEGLARVPRSSACAPSRT
jgi:anti-sigma factor RsiW